MSSSKLVLGTVQFGLSYGIANQMGKTNFAEAKRILEFASQHKISCLDTAIAYGNSEQVIGKIGVSKFNIVSKLPPLPLDVVDIESWVIQHVQDSLRRLNVKSLYGLLLHRSENLLGSRGKNLADALEKVRLSGLANKIGVSIYDPAELNYSVDHLPIDIIQAPLNVVDRRLETSGWLSKLHQAGVEVHARSAFLQGLLLMPRNNIPPKFKAWGLLWDNWSAKLKEAKVSAASVCLSYPLSLPEVQCVVVGVDNVDQLEEIIAASQVPFPLHDFSFMTLEDQMLIDPSNWSSL